MEFQQQFGAEGADPNNAATDGVTMHGGVVRFQFGVPQPTASPDTGPRVGTPGSFVVDTASGGVKETGVSRYQAGAVAEAPLGDVAGILATARTVSGGTPREIAGNSIVSIQGVGRTSVDAAIQAGFLPPNALRLGAAPAPAPIQTRSVGEESARSAEQAAADVIGLLPQPVLAPLMEHLTDPFGDGVTEADLDAVERATGMTRDEFVPKVELAIAGFTRQMRGVVEAHGVDVQQFREWAATHARREFREAVRENVERGTDYKYAALVYRFKQQPK